MKVPCLHSAAYRGMRHLLLATLLKAGAALLLAFLLGWLLEAVPSTADGWSLPVEPAIAASFTA